MQVSVILPSLTSQEIQHPLQCKTFCTNKQILPKKDEDVLLSKHSMTQASGSHPVTVAPATSVKTLRKIDERKIVVTVFH